MLNAQNSGMEKTVTVETPGQLASLLTASEKDDITSLTVSGNLNDDDLRLLRYMAGRDEYGNITPGSLANLDMLNANIVYGGNKGYYVNENGDWSWNGENCFNYRLFKDCHSIQSIILPSSVTFLSSEVFSGCTRLETVRLPEGLERIEWGAFYNCSKLNDINLPSSLRNISTYVFYNCRNLKSIDLSNIVNISMIPGWTFQSSGLTTITIPSNILTIGEGAFDNSKLTSVVFAENSRLKSLGNNSFSNCFDLKTIVIPDSVTSIGNYCFGGSRSLSTVSLSDNSNLVSIGNNAFEGCPLQAFTVPKRVKIMGAQNFSEYLTSLSVAPGNNAIIYSQGIMYCTDGTLIYIDHNSKILNIPESIMMSLNGATRYNGNLETVIIPSSVEDWGDSPFDGDYNLKELYCLSNNPPTVRYLTGGTSGQFTVYVPFGSKSAYMALDEWKNLNIVELPARPEIRLSTSNLSLGNVKGMKSNESLSAVIMTPTGLSDAEVTWTTSDSNVANVSTDGVVSIMDKSGISTITAMAVVENTTITAQCNVKVSIFDDSDNIYYLTAENSLRSLIGDDNKYNVEKLVLMGQLSDDDRNFIREMACNHWEGNQEVAGSLKFIDMSELTDSVLWPYAFQNSKSLESVTLPLTIKRIEEGAFENCSNITSLNIPEGVIEIGRAAFEGCSNLGAVVLPEGLRIIGAYSFYDCSGIKDIVLPLTLVSIGEYAFYGCRNISRYILPESLKYIGYNAFGNYVGNKAIVTLSATPAQCNSGTFEQVDTCNVILVVPEGSLAAYRQAEEWKNFKYIRELNDKPMIMLSDNSIKLFGLEQESARTARISYKVFIRDSFVDTPVSWSTSDESVATITADGLVEYVGPGNAVITASVTNAGNTTTETCDVTAVGITGQGKLVYVETPGTLKTLLTDNEKDNLTTLKVIGNLNTEDLNVLRYMAGSDENGNITAGSLAYLDLLDADIEYLGYQQFKGCRSLQTIILPSNLKTIDSEAFRECSRLESVQMAEGLERIEWGAFYDCGRLSEINLPSSIEYLSTSIFENCRNLKSVDLSNLVNLSMIPSWTFQNSGLTAVVIPSSITSIGEGAFNNTRLSSVVFADGSKLKSIGNSAFQSCSFLKSVTIPASVMSLGEYSFNNCNSLKAVTLAEDGNLTSIGRYVFDGCPIQSFTVPRRVKVMGFQNFSDSLRGLTIADGNTSIRYDGGVLTSLTDGTIIYIDKLTRSLFLPDYISMTALDGQLRYRNNLESVIIPPSIQNWGDNPFEGDYNLKELYCLSTNPPAVRYLTSGTSGQFTVYVPFGSKSMFMEDDEWKNLNIVELGARPEIMLSNGRLQMGNINGMPSSATLMALIMTPVGPSNETVSWASADSSIATVSPDGTVYAGNKTGTTTVTAKAVIDGETLTAQCIVNVSIYDNTDNVYYVSAGNLRNLIPDNERLEISRLILIGDLNVEDIKTIREMIGVDGYWPYRYEGQNNYGKLEYLDISNVNIIGGQNGIGMIDEENNWISYDKTETNAIGPGFFENSRTLKTILLPNSVTRIDKMALANCVNLETIVLPDGLSYIGARAFTGSTAYLAANSTFTIPASIDSLAKDALVGFGTVLANSAIPVKLTGKSLVDEEGIVIVPASALNVYKTADNWSAFSSRIIPDNANLSTSMDVFVTAEAETSGLLKAIGSDEALGLIQDLKLSGTINSYDILLIRNRMPRLHNLDMTDVTIVSNPYDYYTGSHTETNRISSNTFREMNNLRTVILPKSIDYVGDYAFYRCNNLISVKMWKGVNTIDNYVFQECRNLKNVELPEGLLSIGYSAFSQCENLESIILPSTLKAIGSSIFQNCSNLKSIVLPDEIKVIENYSFGWCYNLESVVLPSKLNRIDYYAFASCNKLKELRIPPMVDGIGDYVFTDCNNIEDVYVYIANPLDIRIDMNTFSCWDKATLHIPSFSYEAYYWNTQWGQFYNKIEFNETYSEFYTKNTLALNSATGTIEGNPDATLYEQGGLVVSDVEQDLGNVELISDATTGETNGASIIADTNGKIKADKLTIRIKVAQHKWHFFCFPFDIQLDSIQYDGEYVWRQYDGYKRSRHDGGWQDLDENVKKLHKGRGYIFQGTVDGELVMTVNAPDLSAKDETTTLFSYESENPSDASWNFVGNPYTSYYNIDDAAYDAPITVWTGNGYEAYRPGDDDYAFYPYQAFFVQAPADGSSINFSTDGRDTYDGAMQKVAAGVARRASARVNPDRLLVNLNIIALGDSTYTDKTRVVFNNNHTMDYELGCDAAKFFSENRSIEIYTLDNEGTKYSINERPVADGTVMMSISVNKTGMYGISASRMDTPITIEDKLTGDMFDLSQGEYVFSAKQGESNRFVLHATGGIVSSVKNIGNNKNERKNDIFNLSGTRISETDANGIIIINNEKVLVK